MVSGSHFQGSQRHAWIGQMSGEQLCFADCRHFPLVALQYNILSVVKRFTAYETMGKLIEDITKDSLELSVTDRIWGALQEIVIAIANLFGLVDEDIYDAIINRSEELSHICDIYYLKLVS